MTVGEFENQHNSDSVSLSKQVVLYALTAPRLKSSGK